MKTEKKEFTKYERARIIGARGLQIAMDAPLLLKMNEDELNGINYDPLKIAEKELDSGVLPITVNQPIPQKKESSIDKIRIEDAPSDEAKEKMEMEETNDIVETGDIMKLNEDDDLDVEEDLSVGDDSD